MTTQPTPGPWRFSEYHINKSAIVTVDQNEHADPYNDMCIECHSATGGKEVDIANARLIAKLPSLLNDLKELSRMWHGWAGEPSTAAKGCGNVDDERGEASDDAYRFCAGQLRLLIEKAEGEICCGHTSDCAVHNAPAEAVGPCNCGSETAGA